MGEAGNGSLGLTFDSRLKLEFHGAKITYHSFRYAAGTWEEERRVVAKIEWLGRARKLPRAGPPARQCAAGSPASPR